MKIYHIEHLLPFSYVNQVEEVMFPQINQPLVEHQ